MRLLLVEDNAKLSETMLSGYRTAGLDADILTSIDDARAVLLTSYYVALVLDLDLSGGAVLPLIHEIRARNIYLPILIITARAAISERVKGLRSGADDYLIKPFANEELLARTQALLRRMPDGERQALKLANLVLLPGSHLVINGQPQYLHGRNLSILEVLLQKKGRIVPKGFMADHIAPGFHGLSGNAIEVHVSRLRKTLEKLEAEVSIETVNGVGYRIHEKPRSSLARGPRNTQEHPPGPSGDAPIRQPPSTHTSGQKCNCNASLGMTPSGHCRLSIAFRRKTFRSIDSNVA